MKFSDPVFAVFFYVAIKLVSAATDAALVKSYDDKVCRNEPTCDLISSPGLPASRLTFDGRDCMCDFECVEYGDCCKDSEYYKAPALSNSQKTYICPSESKVYMVASCPSSYADEDVKNKCSKGSLPPEENTIYITPVTNKQKRITYANAYCAFCNGEEDYEPWNLIAGCADAPAGSTQSSLNTRAVLSSPSSNSNLEAASTGGDSKSKDKVSVGLHFNPAAVLGSHKSASDGFNKEITLPTFGLSDQINKTIGSSTGIFGVKLSRTKRQTKNFSKYAGKLDEILKTVKYDSATKQFIGKYENKDVICEFGTKIPTILKDNVRKCVPNLISECPGNAEGTKACQSYTAIVYDKQTKKAYRNRECAACNNASNDISGCPGGVRTASSTLFSTGTKSAGGDNCSDPKVAAKFCS